MGQHAHQCAHRKMQRRGAVICHRRLPMQSPSSNCSMRSMTSTTSMNSSVYSDTPSMRSFSRRFALCSEFDPSVLQALRKFAAECPSSSEFLDDVSYALETTMRTRAQAKPTDVLFSSYKHNRSLDDRSHEGNIQFQSILHSYYYDLYQFAPSVTHRSIVYSAVLDDLKSRGFVFLQGHRQGQGQHCVHNDESFYVMDDLDALRKIKRAFKRLTRRYAQKA